MKKIGIWLAVTLTLSGCATMYQSMGLATSADLAARDQRIEGLEAQVKDTLSKVDETAATAKKVGEEAKMVAERAAEVEALMRSLQGKVDQLPQETLRRLADILNKAAQETGPAPTKP